MKANRQETTLGRDLTVRVDRIGTRAWFGLFALLAFLRSPHIFLEGRFWAEEGSVHFAHAYTEGGLAGLTFVDQRAGYLNLVPNVGTWLATLVPLSAAPLVTAWLSYVLLLFMLWITLAWSSELLPSKPSQLAAAGLLLFGPAAHPEVWLNTINIQTYLGIVAIILLFVRLDDLSPAGFGVSTAVLLIAALSGLYTVVLTPLFLLRAYRARTRRSIVHAAAVCGATAFQAVVVLVSRTSGSLEESKLVLPGLRELVATVAGLHTAPVFLGRQESAALATNMLSNSGPWLWTVLLVGGLVVAIIALAVRESSVGILVLLGGAWVLTEILVQLGAWGIADGRYTVVPLAIASLLLAHGVGIAATPLGRGFALGVVAIALVAGAAEYWTDGRIALSCVDCPDWQEEIDQWESDPTDDLQIWPYPPWPYSPWYVELAGD